MMRKPVILLILAVPLLAFSQSAPAQQSKVDVRKLADDIICTCGCGATVTNCQNSMTCEDAVRLKAELREMADQGMTRDQILASMAQKYGETVLAAPTKRGFNLTAWVMPFAAMFAGGLVVFVVVRKWTRREATEAGPATDQPTEAPQPANLDPDLDRRIERELQDLED